MLFTAVPFKELPQVPPAAVANDCNVEALPSPFMPNDRAELTPKYFIKLTQLQSLSFRCPILMPSVSLEFPALTRVVVIVVVIEAADTIDKHNDTVIKIKSRFFV